MVLLNRKEKEALVIKLAKDGNPYREIVKVVRISPAEIKKILDKATGDEDSQQEDNKEKEKPKKLSPYANAIQMFKEGCELADVVIELDEDADTILHYYSDYSRLKRMDGVVAAYYATKKNFPLFMQLFSWVQKEGFNEDTISELLKKQYSTEDLDKILAFYHNRISELKDRKLALEQEINSLQRRRDNYDGINPI
jgi:transposase